jgi:ATP-dependent Clp protease protease subunit
MRIWYSLQQNTTGDSAELLIYDEIGKSPFNDDAIGASQFIAELDALPASVRALTVRLNSPGGSVFDGISIFNALREQETAKGRTVTTIVDGLAASIASLIAMAGSQRRIAENGLLMLHKAWGVVIGNADDMRKSGETFDKIDDTIVGTMSKRSGQTEDAIRAMMSVETWLSADESVAQGFMTASVATSDAPAAKFSPQALARYTVPPRFQPRIAALTRTAPPALSTDAVISLCAEANLDLEFARGLLAAHQSTDDIKAAITAETTRRASLRRHDADVRAICKMAGPQMAALADDLVAAAIPVALASKIAVTLKAAADHIEIDGSLLPTVGNRRAQPSAADTLGYDKLNIPSAK